MTVILLQFTGNWYQNVEGPLYLKLQLSMLVSVLDVVALDWKDRFTAGRTN